jgi:hypothetical protein
MNKLKFKRAAALLLDIRVYFHEWLYPLGPRWLSAFAGLAFFAWFEAREPHFGKNIPYRMTRYAIVRIERVAQLSGRQKPSVPIQQQLFFRVDGRAVGCPASFHAVPGDYISINYMTDFKGNILVSSVFPIKR